MNECQKRYAEPKKTDIKEQTLHDFNLYKKRKTTHRYNKQF